MASREMVGKVLALFGATFPKDVTPELVIVWVEVMRDVEDDALAKAARLALAQCRFFPVPAEVRALLPKPPAPDAEALISRIWGLADYHPSRGTTPPRVEAVRELLGEAVGEAYSMAGGGFRLFADNPTTASIARRDFAQALVEAVDAGLAIVERPVLALPSGDSGAIVYDDRPRVTGGFRRLTAPAAPLPRSTP